MLWTIEHEGFHGLTTLRIRVPAGSEKGDAVRVSDRVANRLDRAVCGISECLCDKVVTVSGLHLGYPDHDRYVIL